MTLKADRDPKLTPIANRNNTPTDEQVFGEDAEITFPAQPIKPGYYWAKLKYKADHYPADLFLVDSNIHIWTLDKQQVWRDISLFEIIAPALPPDQWPTAGTLLSLAKALDNEKLAFPFMEGFMVCYELFTGKEFDPPIPEERPTVLLSGTNEITPETPEQTTQRIESFREMMNDSMTFWVKDNHCETHGLGRYEENCIKLKGKQIEDDGRVLSVTIKGDQVEFMEGCDQYYNNAYTKEEALKLVDELKQWIINH